ncbi:hypothetical protein [Planomicrobium sp. Y74]|uniref:hypothetical protein n=1 Tax=Planomicrobium sp. Y74 TaxID=2478977 RepID=UPI000EF4A17B|nr:hypothetical protein [Planomicrobium sp. Y74]RLQ89852.1 hypothetical protein D9754_13745 [Planomicrobium sp. Y74]
MTNIEAALKSEVQKVGSLFHAETDYQSGKVIVKKNRTLEISMYNNCFICTLDHDISFEDFSATGTAFNKAEIMLLPEEYPAFTYALSNHPIPFPSHFRQWLNVNPHLISVCLETTESPGHFADRLATALQILEE